MLKKSIAFRENMWYIKIKIISGIRTMIKKGLKFFLLLVVILSFISYQLLYGTVLKSYSLEKLTKTADLIFIGKIKKIEAKWNEKRSKISTDVTFEVQQMIKGWVNKSHIKIKLPGGYIESEDIGQHVSGIPQFKVGDEAVIFLSTKPKRFCPIVGWVQGKFPIVTIPETGEKVISDRLNKFLDYQKKTGRLFAPVEIEKEKKVEKPLEVKKPEKEKKIKKINHYKLQDFIQTIEEIQRGN